MRTKVLLSVLVLFSLLASCNMPAGPMPVTQPPGNDPVSMDVDAVGTAVELTAAARLTEMAGSAATSTPVPTVTLAPTQCSPLVTATVNANVRSGPGTAYDIVGALLLGQTATIIGRNDAYTWWYISYPSTGNYAWIAGSVVTSTCVPAVVQVVAAPPLPTAGPVVVESSSDDSGADSGADGGSSSGTPDLLPVGMSVSPDPAMQGQELQILVGVRNAGDAPSGSFTMQWWSSHSKVACEWTVPSLAPGESVNRTCSYTYGGWANYDIKLLIDPTNAVAESNEGNNVFARKLQVHDAP